jgi:hypothetical protein
MSIRVKPSKTAASALACIVLAQLPAQAAGTVALQWVQPEQYSDIGRGAFDRERTIKSLTEIFQSLGRELPDGQVLKIEVLDVDLAGELRPAAGNEVRVMRGRADWPQMRLHYTLSQGGQTLKEGDARLSDMNYLPGLLGRETFEGGMPYERHMVRHWFDETFAHPKP